MSDVSRAWRGRRSSRSKRTNSARSLVERQTRPIYLDANESPFGEGGLNRYPEPQPRALVERFGELYGVAGDRLVVGRGSDEAIDLLVRAFCRPGKDAILICPPTYGVYEIAAAIQGARSRPRPADARDGTGARRARHRRSAGLAAGEDRLPLLAE